MKTDDTTYTITNLSQGAAIGLFLLGAVVAVVFIVAYIKIITKAGYSPWWVLILLVPIANVVMLLVFAYKEWPIQRELAALRARANQAPRGDQFQPGAAQPGYGQQ
jgi:hypothetical protein